MHECPNCGFQIEDSGEEICPKCGFDFNSTLSCPFKISKRCAHTHQPCTIVGLNYESCKTYLHKTGISQ